MIQGKDSPELFNGAIWNAFDTILTSILLGGSRDPPPRKFVFLQVLEIKSFN